MGVCSCSFMLHQRGNMSPLVISKTKNRNRKWKYNLLSNHYMCLMILVFNKGEGGGGGQFMKLECWGCSIPFLDTTITISYHSFMSLCSKQRTSNLNFHGAQWWNIQYPSCFYLAYVKGPHLNWTLTCFCLDIFVSMWWALKGKGSTCVCTLIN